MSEGRTRNRQKMRDTVEFIENLKRESAALRGELEAMKKERDTYLANWHGAECHFQIATKALMDDMTAVACELVEREAEYQRAHDLGSAGASKGHAYKVRAEAAESRCEAMRGALEAILPLAEERVRVISKSPSSHQEFVRDDQEKIYAARRALTRPAAPSEDGGEAARIEWALVEASNPGNVPYRIKMALEVLATAVKSRHGHGDVVRAATRAALDAAVVLRVAADRVIARPRTWRELVPARDAMSKAFSALSSAECAALTPRPEACAEPEKHPRSECQASHRPCSRCRPPEARP